MDDNETLCNLIQNEFLDIPTVFNLLSGARLDEADDYTSEKPGDPVLVINVGQSNQTTHDGIDVVRPFADEAVREVARALKRKADSQPPSRSNSREQREWFDTLLDQPEPPPPASKDPDVVSVPPPQELVDVQGNADFLKEIEMQVQAEESGVGSRIILVPTSREARLAVLRWYECLRLMESAYVSAAVAASIPPLDSLRTTSDRAFPIPSDFQPRRISAASGQLFPAAAAASAAATGVAGGATGGGEGLINVAALASVFPTGWLDVLAPGYEGSPPLSARCLVHKVEGSQDLMGGKRQRTFDGEAKICKFSVAFPGGDEKVVLRVWRDGTTQVSGCSSPTSVWLANCAVYFTILRLCVSGHNVLQLADGAGGLARLWDATAPSAVQAAASMGSEYAAAGWDLQLKRMSVMGSWDLGLAQVDARLCLVPLLAFLSTRPGLIQKARILGEGREGPAAKLSQVGIYVLKSCLSTCSGEVAKGVESDLMDEEGELVVRPAGGGKPDRDVVYVNLSHSGKCVTMGVSSIAVGRELASKLSSLLIEAFADDTAGVREALISGEAARLQRGVPTPDTQQTCRRRLLQKTV